MPLEYAGGTMCEKFGSLFYGIPFWPLTAAQHHCTSKSRILQKNEKREPGEKSIVVMFLLL